MPKQKQLLKLNNKKTKHTTAGPETADEFLVAGVELEEAGEKWRAGDASKSSRFFTRALEMYDAGLRRHPNSFDLAYNKARLQYDLSQQSRLLDELPTTLIDLLQLALESHHYALARKENDPDTLFNTAQVLTSLAEALGDSSSAALTNREVASKYLREALDLFERCLGVQEHQFTESQLNESQAMTQTINLPSLRDQPHENNSEKSEEVTHFEGDEQWVSIVEPTTLDTLLDTMIAQIETLTALCPLAATQNPNELSFIEDYYTSVLERASKLAEGKERNQEFSLATVVFVCTYVETKFRVGLLDLATYQRELDEVFRVNHNIFESSRGLCSRADALMSFVISTRSTISISSLSDADRTELNGLHWKYLTKALADLTAATKIPDTINIAKIHLRRGDCELLRYRLSEPLASHPQAVQNAALLLKNAEVYYRGAAKVAKVEMAMHEESEAAVKEAIASCLNSNGITTAGIPRADRDSTRVVIEEMVEDQLLGQEQLKLLQHST